MKMEGYDRARELSAPLLPEPVDDVIVDIGAATVNCKSDRSAGEPGETTSPFEFLLGSTAATHATTTGTAGFSHSLPLSHPPTPLDPFANRTERIEGLYEWAKIVVCIPLAIVRLVFFGLALAVGFIATKMALLGWEDTQNPMPRWRCKVMWVTRFCSRLILFCFGYHWIRRKGKPAARELAPIVVCNHVSYVEPIYFFYELSPTIVASESHDGIPFVGTIIRAMQTSHAIGSALNVVQTFHSYGDLLLLLKASEQGYERASAFMVEMARFDNLFSINTLEPVGFLERFMEMKPDCSGRVQMDNFLNSLRLRQSPLTEKVFAFLDVEQRGSITFRQFLYGSACLLRQPSFRPACEVIFDNYDDNEEGYILEPQFGNALRCGDPYLSEKNVHELYTLFDVDKDGVVGSNDFMICLLKNPVLIGLFPSCTGIETV